MTDEMKECECEDCIDCDCDECEDCSECPDCACPASEGGSETEKILRHKKYKLVKRNRKLLRGHSASEEFFKIAEREDVNPKEGKEKVGRC